MPVPLKLPEPSREPPSITAFIKAGHPREAFVLALFWQARSIVLALAVAGVYLWFG